jgi:GntR family transcriptional regulator
VEQIEQLIASHHLNPGDQLPTVRELATELKVNWNTVARAYRMLDEAHLISTQRGRGTYVWELPNEETLRLLRQESLDGLTRRYLREAAERGSTPEEVYETFQQQLETWKQGVQPQEE